MVAGGDFMPCRRIPSAQGTGMAEPDPGCIAMASTSGSSRKSSLFGPLSPAGFVLRIE
jgi:hypothetical protein